MLLEKLPLRIFVDLSVFRRHGNMKKSSLAPPPFFFFASSRANSDTVCSAWQIHEMHKYIKTQRFLSKLGTEH